MPDSPPTAVFLSYTSQDVEPARRICDALRFAGFEVWFDQCELSGGDMWDQKIRRQIRECALFVAIISQNTQTRSEGYFRLEWKLADDRTHLMARGTPFLVPVCVDGTPDWDAVVPDSFMAAQWTRLPGGATTPVFVEQIGRLLRSPRTAPPSLTAFPVAGRPKKFGGVRWALGATVAAGLLMWWLARRTPANADAAGPPAVAPVAATIAVADPKSIAVLPFDNLSADKDNEYFSNGLSEIILDKLARNPGLNVMARTSSFSYQGRNASTAQIARELGVGTLIGGSVQRAGHKLRIAVHLINAAAGTQVWSETFDREMTDIFAVQDEIALKIATRLQPGAAPAAAPVLPPTQNLAAFDAYLRGRDLLSKTSLAWPQAAEALQRAVGLDPKFALAWANLGRARVQISSGSVSLAAAKSAIDEALRLQPDLPEAHLAHSLHMSANGGRLAAALQELDLAEKVRPHDSEIIAARALLVMQQGRRIDAISLARTAVQLDPRNGANVITLGNWLRMDGRYAEAEKIYAEAFPLLGSSIPLTNQALNHFQGQGDRARTRRALDEVPAELQSNTTYWSVRQYLLYALGDHAGALAAFDQLLTVDRAFAWRLAIVAARSRAALGDAAGAEAEYRAALVVIERARRQLPESQTPCALLALALAELGRKDEALAMARKCLALVPPAENPYAASGVGGIYYGGLNALAQVEAQFGMIDEALAIVKEQAAAGWWRRNYLLLHPDWSGLRKDPRFQAIAERAPL